MYRERGCSWFGVPSLQYREIIYKRIEGVVGLVDNRFDKDIPSLSTKAVSTSTDFSETGRNARRVSRYRQPVILQLIHMRIFQQLSVHKAPPVVRVPETSPIPDPEHTGSPHRPGPSPEFGKAVT